MARITRKKFGMNLEEKEHTRKSYRVGIYARLSVKNVPIKMESIENQIGICKEYINKNGNMIWVDSYVDIGKSGMNFHRREFVRMVEEAKQGKINCIIAKDLSRIGRNHLETGDYLEKFFPEHDIRIIAVNDCFDSLQQEGTEELLSLQNLVNEMYARDISRKVSSVKKQKWKQGEYIGGVPPYGYEIVKGEGGRRLIMHRETGEIVKKIYQWYLEGMDIREIVELLQQEGANPPSQFRKSGKAREREGRAETSWSLSGVKQILMNPVYLGCMMKTEVKHCQITSEKDLENFGSFLQKNTHAPIISRGDFFKVAEIIRDKGK